MPPVQGAACPLVSPTRVCGPSCAAWGDLLEECARSRMWGTWLGGECIGPGLICPLQPGPEALPAPVTPSSPSVPQACLRLHYTQLGGPGTSVSPASPWTNTVPGQTEGSVSHFLPLDSEDVLGHSLWGFHPKCHQSKSVTFCDFCTCCGAPCAVVSAL